MIDYDAFGGCSSLASVSFPLTEAEWNALGGWDYFEAAAYSNEELVNATLILVKPVFTYADLAGGVIITGCTNIERFPDLVIPAEIDGKTVLRIDGMAFSGAAIKSVTLPDSLERINSGAFGNCAALEAVSFGSGLKTIANQAFLNCGSLTSVAFPDSLEAIDKSAFAGCAALATVTFGSGLKTIGEGAFNRCASLTSAAFPDSLESIGGAAFIYCTALATVTFGSGLKSIGDDAFSNCPSLTSVTFPDSLETIGNDAFYGCYGLESVTFGSGLKSIGFNAFDACSALKSVTLPDSLESIGSSAFGICVNLETVVFGSGLKSIGDYAFRFCDKLESVTLPASLETIAEHAFYNSGLKAVAVPFTAAEWTAAGGWTYYGVTETNNAELYNAAPAFVQPAFTYTDIEGGVSITGCTNLDRFTELVIPAEIDGKAVLAIGNSAFYRCRSLTSVVFPDSLESIGDDAFSNCDAIASITFGSGLKTIGEEAFEDCHALTSVTFPDSLETIGDAAFIYCYELATVTFGSGLKSIGESAFRNCKLSALTFPDSLESIGEMAFMQCRYLKTVTLPEGIETIGADAFSGCALETVTYGGTRRQWNAIDVSNAGLPNGVTVICKGDFAADTAISVSGEETFGETLTATVTGLPADVEDAVISWYNDDGDLLGTGETYVITAADVGHAVKAVLSSENAVASVSSDFTAVAGKARITNYTLPTAASIKYPQTLADATLTGGDTGAVEGVWAWSTPDVQPTSAQSGSSFELTFTPTGAYAGGYETITARLAVIVEPADFEPQTMEDTQSGLSVTGDFAQNVTLTLTDITYSQSAYIAMLRASSKDASGLPVLVLFKTFDFGVDADAYAGTLTVSSYVGEKYAGNTYSVWFFVDGAPVCYEGTVDADGVIFINGVTL